MPQQRPPVSGPGDWGMTRSAGSPAVRPGHTGMGRAVPMAGPMISRSNSLPGNTRSMLQQQLMDMGMSLHVCSVTHKSLKSVTVSGDIIPPPATFLAVSTSAGTNETGMSMSRFGGPGPPPQSPSWQGSPLGVDGPQRNTSR